MSRRSIRSAAVLMTVVLAVSASACGSSSKSKTTAPAASTPATPTTGTSTTAAVPRPPLSTPITSPVVRSYLVARYSQALAGRNVPPAKISQLADCVIKKLDSQGVKTYGAARKAQNTLVRADQTACVKQVGLR